MRENYDFKGSPRGVLYGKIKSRKGLSETSNAYDAAPLSTVTDDVNAERWRGRWEKF